MTVEFVSRHEIAEDVRAGGGAHALGGEQILDAERNAFERAALALRDLGVRLARHGARLLRRLQHKGIERARRFDRRRCASVSSSEVKDFFARPSRASASVSDVKSVIY